MEAENTEIEGSVVPTDAATASNGSGGDEKKKVTTFAEDTKTERGEASAENNGGVKTSSASASALQEEDNVKPAPASAAPAPAPAPTAPTIRSADQPPPTSSILRKDTLSKLASKRNMKVPEAAIPDEIDANGWFVYRGSGEVKLHTKKSVKAVRIHPSVTFIPDKAFYGCSQLKIVRFASVEEQEEEEAAAAATMASTTTNSGSASGGGGAGGGGEGGGNNSSNTNRRGCTLTAIGQFAFYECKELTTIQNMPSTVASIGEYAFSGCAKLVTIQLPEALTSIEEGTFSDCPNLTAVILPDSIASISMFAFYGCASLTNILLPKYEVVSIEEEAFEGCQTLQRLCNAMSLSMSAHDDAMDVSGHNNTMGNNSNNGTGGTGRRRSWTLNEWLQRRYTNLPLHRLCYSPSISDLEVLVFKRQIDICDASRMNPLHILALNPAVMGSHDDSSDNNNSSNINNNHNGNNSLAVNMISSMVRNSQQPQSLLGGQDLQGRTPLHYAVMNPYVDLNTIVAMMAVDHHTRSFVSFQDKNHKSPTALAIDCQRPSDIQQWLYRFHPVQAKELACDGITADQIITELDTTYLTNLIDKIGGSGGSTTTTTTSTAGAASVTAADSDDGSLFVLSWSSSDQHGWVRFASQVKGDDLIQTLVRFLGVCERNVAKALANATDYQGRVAMNVAVPPVKHALQTALLFYGRFDLEERPRYQSATSVVYFARDLKPNEHVTSSSLSSSLTGSGNSHTNGDSGGGGGVVASSVPVAIKFYHDKDVFEAELLSRFYGVDAAAVATATTGAATASSSTTTPDARDYYGYEDGSSEFYSANMDTSESNKATTSSSSNNNSTNAASLGQLLQQQRFNSDFVVPCVSMHNCERDRLEAMKVELPLYCMVLERAECNLTEALHREPLTAQPLAVCNALFELAQCLHHLHEQGFVHGNFLPKNICSCHSGSNSNFRHPAVLANNKPASSTTANPNNTDGSNDGAATATTGSGGDSKEAKRENSIRGIDTSGTDPAARRRRWSLIDLESSVEVGQPMTRLDKVCTAYVPPERLRVENKEVIVVPNFVAHPSIDAWAFGVVMFQLVTGKIHLLAECGLDLYDNLDDKAGLKKLCQWSDSDVKEKLSQVPTGHAKELLSKLLNKKPEKRPSMEEIIKEDPFFDHQRKLMELESIMEAAKNAENGSIVDAVIKEIEDLNRDWKGNPQAMGMGIGSSTATNKDKEREKRGYFHDLYRQCGVILQKGGSNNKAKGGSPRRARRPSLDFFGWGDSNNNNNNNNNNSSADPPPVPDSSSYFRSPSARLNKKSPSSTARSKPRRARRASIGGTSDWGTGSLDFGTGGGGGGGGKRRTSMGSTERSMSSTGWSSRDLGAGSGGFLDQALADAAAASYYPISPDDVVANSGAATTSSHSNDNGITDDYQYGSQHPPQQQAQAQQPAAPPPPMRRRRGRRRRNSVF